MNRSDPEVAAHTPNQAPAEGSITLDAAGQALFQLGRIFARQPMAQVVTQRTGQGVELSRILVTEAVASAIEQRHDQVTIGLIAERLAIDPSTASRLVADTIQDGYLERTQAQADARRSVLTLTDAGRALVQHAHQYQRAVFDTLTAAWSDDDRQTFARLLVQLTESVALLPGLHTPPPH